TAALCAHIVVDCQVGGASFRTLGRIPQRGEVRSKTCRDRIKDNVRDRMSHRSTGSDQRTRQGRRNTTDGQNVAWVGERISGPRDVAWAPSLNVSRRMIASCGQDGRVIVWVSASSTDPNAVHHGATLEPSEYTHRPGGTSWLPVVLYTYSDVVWHVSWSITGNILAVSGGDNKVSTLNHSHIHQRVP
ncbi:protein transport protein SEC13, partial [Paragonimus westermani]